MRFKFENESIAFILGTLGPNQSLSAFNDNNKVVKAMREFISDLLQLSIEELIYIKDDVSYDNDYYNEYSEITKSIRQSKASGGDSFQHLIVSVISYKIHGVTVPQLIWCIDADYHFSIHQLNILENKLAQLGNIEITITSIYEIADSLINEN